MSGPVPSYLVPDSILNRANVTFGTAVVLASDYDTLRTANQRLESELAAIRSTIRTDNSAVIAGLQADKQRLEGEVARLREESRNAAKILRTMIENIESKGN
jgi:peptidoglycan hydrolase CwlO-like protein